jgi:hypothetical protein
LTLAQVAERSSLNVGYLSQIENDKASPSLESLSAIGAALDVPIAWFLQDASVPPRVVRAADRRTWASPGGGRVEEVDGGVSRDLCIVEVTGVPGGAQAHPATSTTSCSGARIVSAGRAQRRARPRGLHALGRDDPP